MNPLTEDQIKAVNASVMDFWRKLNNAPMPVYLRFQRLFARRHGGKWIRGISINERLELGFVLE